MFTPETLHFLAENRFQNSRVWYAEHKAEFKEYVMQPMIETVEFLAPTLEKIDPLIVTEPKVDKTISRIYRDMRRAHGSFYREVMWLTFKRDKVMFPRYPEFFLVFSPQEFFYGCGYYAATGDAMRCMRQMVLADDPAFRRADKASRAQKVLQIDGEAYKRSRFPDATPKQRNWVDRRSVSFIHTGDPWAELFDPDLPQKLADAFYGAREIYRFFLAAEQKAAELRG